MIDRFLFFLLSLLFLITSFFNFLEVAFVFLFLSEFINWEEGCHIVWSILQNQKLIYIFLLSLLWILFRIVEFWSILIGYIIFKIFPFLLQNQFLLFQLLFHHLLKHIFLHLEAEQGSFGLFFFFTFHFEKVFRKTFTGTRSWYPSF